MSFCSGLGRSVAGFEGAEVGACFDDGLTIAPDDGDGRWEERMGAGAPGVPAIGLGVFDAAGVISEGGLDALGDSDLEIAIGDAGGDELVDAKILPLNLIATGRGLHVGARSHAG